MPTYVASERLYVSELGRKVNPGEEIELEAGAAARYKGSLNPAREKAVAHPRAVRSKSEERRLQEVTPPPPEAGDVKHEDRVQHKALRRRK